MLYLCGMKHKIYVASSWRNEHYPEIVAKFWLVLLVGLLSVLRMSGIAEGFYADRVTICDRNFKGVSVGVNPFKSMDEYGIVGLKFFNIPTIFDFGERKLYLCK